MPHMSTSQCGNICIMQPKCSSKERRRGFCNRSSVEAAMARRHRVFRRKQKQFCVCVCVCVYVCSCVCSRVCSRVWEGDTVTQPLLVCKHIRASLCLSPTLAWTDTKTKDIINNLYIYFKCWSSRLWKGALLSNECLWCSANHNALGQLANQSEGGAL